MIQKFQAWLGLDNKQFKFVVTAICLSLLIRSILIQYLLPYYSVDENEVVESALAFIVGDLDPRFYKYGFLTSYVLAVVYYVYAFIVSLFSSDYLSVQQVLYGVFFDRGDFYFMARMLQAVTNVSIALMIYKIADVYFNRRIAFFALGLLLMPIHEFHLGYTVRVDNMLAFSFLFTTYHALRYNETKRPLNLRFVFIGLALAVSSKPMPALFGFIILLLPFIQSTEKPKFIAQFFLYFIGTSLVVNPYLILNFKEFYSYNYDALFGFQTSSDEMKGYPFGYEFYWTEGYGVYFKYMVVAAMGFFSFKTIVEVRNKKWPMLIFLSMPLAYFLCFSPFHTRYYWFIVLVPYVILMFAYAWDALATKLNQKIATIALLLLISGATLNGVFASNYRAFDAVVFHTSALERADAFLETTLKRNERIIHVARQSRAPQTYNIDLQKEAQHGQYFMYERIRNEGYKNFFIEAHRDLVKKRKTYNVIAFDRANFDQYKGHQLEKLMYTDLLNYAYSNQVKYIILTYDREEYVAEWEADARAEKVFDSFEMNDVYGPNVKVYKLSY